MAKNQPDLRLAKIGGQSFYLPAHIQPASIVGKGSYGVVISAMDSKTNSKVAIKRIKPYAGDEWEARHTLREIRLMRLLHRHPNVISLANLWSRDEDNELYITMELMDSDLHQIIQSKQSLSEPHHQCLMKQLLLGVQAMHKCGVLHRDLKPGNLLVTRDCQLRITDFGLARAWDKSTPDAKESAVGVMTEYVVTRWYRCPELLLAPHIPYDGAIDLWSVGCIFGELLNRRPLFPGKSYVHQVQVILDVLGTPTEADFGFKPRDDAASFLKRQRHRPGITWRQLLPAASERALQFMGSLLTWDPKKRLTVDQALSHRWLSDAPALPCKRCSVEELLASRGEMDFKFEDPATPLPVLKNLVYKEIEIFTGAAEAEKKRKLAEEETARQEKAEVEAAEAAAAAAEAEIAAMEGGGGSAKNAGGGGGRSTPSPSSFLSGPAAMGNVGGGGGGGNRPGTAGSVGSLGRGLGGSRNRPASPTPSSNAQATVAGAIGLSQKSVPINERGVNGSSGGSSNSRGGENSSHSGNVLPSQQQQQQQQQQANVAHHSQHGSAHPRSREGGSSSRGMVGGGGGGALVRRQPVARHAAGGGGGRAFNGNSFAIGQQQAAAGSNALVGRAKAMKQQMMKMEQQQQQPAAAAPSAHHHRGVPLGHVGQQSAVVGSAPRRSLPNIQNGIASLANRSAASKQLFASSSARDSSASAALRQQVNGHHASGSGSSSAALHDPLRAVRRAASGGVEGLLRGQRQGTR